MTQTSARAITRGQWIAIAISILAVLVAFTQINFQTISSGISRLVSPTADFTIESYSTPQSLPLGFLYSLNPASNYYVTTSIHLGTNTPYVGNSFYLSVSFDNKGKKSVLEPYLVIYFADMFSREWASWNRTLTNGEFSNGFSIAYNFPTLDQKTTGAWSVTTVLYSNATGELVSVNTTEFNVTDIAPPPAWAVDLLFGSFLVIIIVMGILTLRKAIIDRKKAQARKTKRAEKEEKTDKKEEKEGTGKGV
jgi:hypothetical protein